MADGREAEAVAALLGDRTGPGPVPPDGVLMVHSAFRGLSRRGFRAEAFIDALLAYMQGGTVLMPTMTWRTVTPANPVFDELRTPSHTGILSEIFRTHYATHRSLHPTHSVAGIGPAAAYLLGGHHLGDTPCPPDSPYGRMRRFEGHILLLGVGLASCTAIHHVEEMVAPDIYLRPPAEAESYELIARTGEVLRMRLRRHLRLKFNFPMFGPPLAAKGQIAAGRIGETAWLRVPARALLAEVEAALARRPDAIIARPG